ncbi:hypothetical protein G4D61_11140 [Bacillus ginsengihumi]|uniref:Uncharacterized protein n=1 Tax=Heyndrickxia ginsengihumi TaxID=363870 RepID=A0A0A6VBR2_9BACI|nr:hypothetical protein [Heyndrickxia ginsengihumi]KHD85675.1 hypothetical protein NG54_07875 [Heyndrickxia ginsengihumi]NEY20510.1 hypothetical protein [Heyndrickxia ginsengihumi]
MPKVARSTRRMRVRTDLHNQLKQNKMTANHWYDLVEDYMALWDIKEDLIKSIKKYGAMVVGRYGPKKNDAVSELPKINKRMTEILSVLNIESVVVEDDGDDI